MADFKPLFANTTVSTQAITDFCNMTNPHFEAFRQSMESETRTLPMFLNDKLYAHYLQNVDLFLRLYCIQPTPTLRAVNGAMRDFLTFGEAYLMPVEDIYALMIELFQQLNGQLISLELYEAMPRLAKARERVMSRFFKACS